MLKSFYRAFNAVFGKVAGVASEEVTVELLKVKCIYLCCYTVLRHARLVTNSSTRYRLCTERLLQEDISYKVC